MAIWQFKMELVPILWATQQEFGVEELYSDEGYDVSITWIGNQPESAVENLIEEFLPRGRSWHEDLTVFGDLETTDVQIWIREGAMESLGIRIDLRENMDAFLEDIISIAKRMNCCIFVPESKTIFEPELRKINQEIEKSNAFRFLNNPAKYLESLRET